MGRPGVKLPHIPLDYPVRPHRPLAAPVPTPQTALADALRLLADVIEQWAPLPPPIAPMPAPPTAPVAAAQTALTVAQAARALQCSPTTVKRLCASGALPSFGVGRLRRISAAALEAWQGGHE